MAKYNWINDEVKIDFEVEDEVLRNTINDCERFDLAHDFQYFGMAEAIDNLCKMFYAGGHMNQEEWDKLVGRYPGL